MNKKYRSIMGMALVLGTAALGFLFGGCRAENNSDRPWGNSTHDDRPGYESPDSTHVNADSRQ